VFQRNFDKAVEKLKEFRQLIGVPIVVIHVMRDPFDMVATEVSFYNEYHFSVRFICVSQLDLMCVSP
jgi:hypothetical protein